jgi:ribosomal protein S27AE
MRPELAEKLRRRTDRRSFLRGSALLVAAGVVAPLDAWAQSAQNPPPPADQAPPPGNGGTDGPTTDQSEKKTQDAETDKKETAKEGDGEKTYVGADGRPYRVCPQCGANMYKQDRTWTCENCGYSYVE